MVDRFETRSFTNKIDPRLQSLFLSPYAQQQLQLSGILNHRGQIHSINNCLRSLSRRKRQRRERDAITQEIVSRAIKIDQNHQRSRRHQFEIAARRVVNNNFNILSRQYRKQSHAQKKNREKSAPNLLIKNENEGERRNRVTSTSNRQSKTDYYPIENTNHEENHLEHINKFNIISVERHACEVTMCYRSPTTTIKSEKPIRDEIVVMQQHSTGENLVVYRGFLTKGESFSFKSQRRPLSPLSLAFYAKGFIDSVVNHCCEFRYGRRSHQINEHSQFAVEHVRKASPCENCRNKYFQRSITSNTNTRSSDLQTQSEKLHRRYLTPTLKSSDKQERPISQMNKINTTNDHENNDKQMTNQVKSKRVSSSKKPNTRERSESIDFSLLESALNTKENISKCLIPVGSSNTSSVNESSTKQGTSRTDEKTSTEGETNFRRWMNHTDIIAWDSSSDTMSDPGNTLPHLKSNPIQSLNILRCEKNVENFIYILDGHITISGKEKKKLRGLINFGLIFDDINDPSSIEFIRDIVHEQIFLILSKTSMKNLDNTIRQATQVRLIYILDNTNDSLNDSEKIRGIYPNLASIYEQIEKDMQILTNKLGTILSISSKDNSNSMFAYTQLMKDILLEMDEKTDLKKEMLDFCREEYAGNSIQLKFIDEFQRQFQDDQAIQWYQREETFLFKMLSRACRTFEPDILFKLRFFLQCLHRQLKSTSSSNTSMTVYRTQFISNQDFDLLKKNQNGFLCFNSFLLTKKTKIFTQRKSLSKLFRNTEYKLMLFQIEIDTILPNMTLESNTEEILFTMATVFRISNFEQIDEDRSKIKLVFHTDVTKKVQDLTKNLRENIRASFPLLRIAKLMKHMEYMYYTEYFCLLLMDNPLIVNDEAANLTVGGLFHTLCSFYYEQEQYDRALEQLEKSLKVYSRVLSSDDIKLTPTYNNMGSIYHKKGLDKQALKYHKKAYDIQIKSSNPDLDSVAAYAGNIASVLIKQNKFEEAIPYLQRDLQIRQRLYPNEDDINLAVKYHNLAGALFRINKYSESLENYRKCLAIELKIHPVDHPTVAVTYYNMATALEGLGQLEEAIEMIQKAQKRLLLSRDENDEEFKMHQDYEKRLQQKLWVKSLFNTN